MTTYSCGCVNEPDPKFGILHCVSKCDFHKRQSLETHRGIRYYVELGALDAEAPSRYWNELMDAKVTERHLSGAVLEVGGGISPYAPRILSNGDQYLGIELDREASQWMTRWLNVPILNEDFEHCKLQYGSFDSVLMAHVVEHLKDAPQALSRTRDLLKSNGYLVIVVPDDTDPTNPDHLWFFNEQTLRSTLHSIGYKNIAIESRKRIERENFLYAVAQKL